MGRFTVPLIIAISCIAAIVVINGKMSKQMMAQFQPMLVSDSKQAPGGGLTGQMPKQSLSSSSYQLAYDQSGGFFDDIPEGEWKMLQQRHYGQFPNHGPNIDMHGDDGKAALIRSHLFYQFHFEPEFACRHERRLGGLGDGPKWVCDPHRISKKKKDCLVYSVGSAGNIMFEKTIKEQVSQDCEIHTFDIMSATKKKGNFAVLLGNYSTFHPWGLSRRDQRHKGMTTLKETVRRLGHENRTIDIFKIDCEGCEWSTFDTWFDAGVTIRQILVETHFSPMPSIREFFYKLHDEGYVIFHKESNFLGGGDLVEYAFVKVSTDFFIGNSLYSAYNP